MNLINAVHQNNPQKVQGAIQELKKEKGWGWELLKGIPESCRDAVRLGHKDIVQIFIDEEFSVNHCAFTDGDDGYLSNMIYFAAIVGNLPMVQLLVENGVQIKNTRYFSDQDDNQDAIRAAITGGYPDVVKYLLENGADPNGTFRSLPFLAKAAYECQYEIAEHLIEHGASTERALEHIGFKFKDEINSIENALNSWNIKDDPDRQQKLLEKKQICLEKFSESVKWILDHVIGIHFENEKYSILNKLGNTDISGFNFIGMSIDGEPISRGMLYDSSLKGAKDALLTLDDLRWVEDHERRDAISARLEAAFQKSGKLMTDYNAVNLVPLAKAASKGHREVVIVRLLAGIDPNQKFNNSLTPIEEAAKMGHMEVVKLLAELPALEPKTRVSAIELANKNHHANVAAYLNSLIDVNEKDKQGNAQIHKALKRMDLKEIDYLLKRGADINLEDKNGNTPLCIACSQIETYEDDDETRLVTFLLQHGADPNKYTDEYSPLYFAACRGSLKLVELLLPITEKRNLKERDSLGLKMHCVEIPWYAPLMFESSDSKEWVAILSLLAAHGADLNHKDRYGNETVLYRFIQNFPSFSEIRNTMRDLKRVIADCEERLGPNPLQKDYERLITNAKEAFAKKFSDLKQLLELGANPSIPCGRDVETTPAHTFIEKIDLSFMDGALEQVLDLFFQYGVTADLRNASGSTLLHSAAYSGDLATATYLINRGADVNARNNEGRTPLHNAAAGDSKITELLINAGADVNAVNNNGETPIAYSKRMCDENNQRYVYPSKERDAPYIDAQRVLFRAGGKK